MRRRFGPLLVVLAVVLAGLPACAKRNCVPEPLTRSRGTLVDVNAPPEGHAVPEAGLAREVGAEFRRKGATMHPAGARPYQFLAVSGGGLYGAFGVGLLEGWTESGARPQFDVVTGVSTGALTATFAFLGQEYDPILRTEIVGVQRRDILRLRSPFLIPFSESLFNPQRMVAKINKYCTLEQMNEVAKAHAAGRRLYVGTTNLDTRRLVIWDMGAIATRGTPEALNLYQHVVMASCSIPGALPPVRISVEVNGRRYEELHVDGGVSDLAIFRGFMVADLNRAAGVNGPQAPPGSTLSVISNGKLYAERSCVRPRIVQMLSSASSSILSGRTRDELYRIYLNCLETGVEFRLAAVAQDVPLGSEGALQLSLADQQRLYEAGHQLGRQAMTGVGWRDIPPGSDPSEQSLPRAGTQFITADGAACEPARCR
jgi:predicted acylesterase/phospholipase RssA